MPEISNWMYVEILSVEQAAALWCGFDPNLISVIDDLNPSELLAAKQVIVDGIYSGQLRAFTGENPYHHIGKHERTLVHRRDLMDLARSKGVYPAFLFDTLAPFQNGATTVEDGKTADTRGKNKGGRPQEYDWDTFIFEIIRLANTPDGLPETQAELIRYMLEWYSENFGSEPAESSVKQRISKIYNYLDKGKNQKD